MYDNFGFEKRNNEVVGYDFPCEDPKYVMCIIHGIGECAGRYQRMADKLGARGIAVMSMDLRGHGISKGVRGDAAPRKEVLADVDALIEYAMEKYPGLPVILYGHSMGGNIGLDYRARGGHNDIPVKYIISAPWIELVNSVDGAKFGFLKFIGKFVPKKQISSSCPEEDLGNPEFVRPYVDNPLVHDKITFRCAIEGLEIGKALAEGTNEDNHRADGKPFLLMHGDADKICSIKGTRKVAARYADKPWFTFIEWPGYYHAES